MLTVGLRLRELRLNCGLSLRNAAKIVSTDIAILSKMERGERQFNKGLIIKLAELYKADIDELLVMFLGEKILYNLKDEEFAAEALVAAEKSILYSKAKKVDLREISEKARQIFLKDSRIEKAWVFGSVARQDQRSGSDLDIMIKIIGGEKFSLFDFIEIQYKLEEISGLKVDIVEEGALSDFVQETILVDKILIYER